MKSCVMVLLSVFLSVTMILAATPATVIAQGCQRCEDCSGIGHRNVEDAIDGNTDYPHDCYALYCIEMIANGVHIPGSCLAGVALEFQEVNRYDVITSPRVRDLMARYPGKFAYDTREARLQLLGCDGSQPLAQWSVQRTLSERVIAVALSILRYGHVAGPAAYAVQVVSDRRSV